jgi:hypothetical protein
MGTMLLNRPNGQDHDAFLFVERRNIGRGEMGKITMAI